MFNDNFRNVLPAAAAAARFDSFVIVYFLPPPPPPHSMPHMYAPPSSAERTDTLAAEQVEVSCEHNGVQCACWLACARACVCVCVFVFVSTYLPPRCNVQQANV